MRPHVINVARKACRMGFASLNMMMLRMRLRMLLLRGWYAVEDVVEDAVVEMLLCR